MADHDETAAVAGDDRTAAVAVRRRGPDVLMLLVGALALVMAVSAFTGQLPGLGALDPRWVLAGAAVLIGVLALGSSTLRGRRRR